MLKRENNDLKNDGKSENNPIEQSQDSSAPLSAKKPETTPESLTKSDHTGNATSVSSTNNSSVAEPRITNYYYSTTNNNNTTSPATPQEKTTPVTAKIQDTTFDLDSFMTNFMSNFSKSISNTFSRDLPKMFSKFLYHFNEIIQKNTLRGLNKTEETTMKNTNSNKKPLFNDTTLDNIKKQCAAVYKSFLDLLNFKGNRKRVSRLSSQDLSLYPNVRTRYRTLGEDFEKPRRSSSSGLFHLSGKRARNVITNGLSSVRRLALDIEKISYNTFDQNKRSSRALKKSDQYTELAFKRSLRRDFVTG